MKHVSCEDVGRMLRQDPTLPDAEGHPAVAVVEISAGHSAWNPASTKPECRVFGPATVTYRKYLDGAVEATVST